MDREALLWDLAGQEDYRLIHRLFLDETALALLLINPQKDDPFAEAGDWLNALDTAVSGDEARRDAAKLLIFSQIDVGGMKIGNAKIERFIQEHRFADWLATSAKTRRELLGRGERGTAVEAEAAHRGSIPWDKLPWTATPRLLAELKSAVLKMRDEPDIRLLRFAELAQRLEQALPGEPFRRVRRAHGGDAAGQSRPGPAAEVRRPGAAAARAAERLRRGDHPRRPRPQGRDRLRAGGGHLQADLRLHRRRAADASAGRGTAAAGDGADVPRSLAVHRRGDAAWPAPVVFPSQYRREKDIHGQPDIFVSYTFSGEWQTIWTTLVVRLWYSQEFEHRELWRTRPSSPPARARPLGLKIDNRRAKARRRISLFFDQDVPDELKVIFIEYVHRHLPSMAAT